MEKIKEGNSVKKLLALMLVFICSISIQAVCQGTNTAPAGKYVLTTMEMDGVDIKDFFIELGMDVDNMCIEIQSGGKFMMSYMGDIKNGAYRLAGKTIIMSPTGENEMKATIEGNKIIIEEKGDSETSGFSSTRMVFEKK